MARPTFRNTRVVKASEAAGQGSETLPFVRVNGQPVPVVVRMRKGQIRRIYRLGQAFHLDLLCTLQPEQHVVVLNADLSEFVSELRSLLDLINHEETHKNITAILLAIESVPDTPERFLALFTGV